MSYLEQISDLTKTWSRNRVAVELLRPDTKTSTKCSRSHKLIGTEKAQSAYRHSICSFNATLLNRKSVSIHTFLTNIFDDCGNSDDITFKFADNHKNGADKRFRVSLHSSPHPFSWLVVNFPKYKVHIHTRSCS